MPKDKEQEVFVEPEFNERDFLSSEKERAKATIVVFLIAAGIGLASGVLYMMGIWYVGVIIMLLLMLYFKRLLKMLHLQVPQVTSHFFFLFMVFFLTWIIFWTVSLNAPLQNIAGPEVKDLQYHFANTNFTNAVETNGIYSISISSNNCNTQFRALVSYIAPLTNVSLMLGGNYVQSNFTDGWLYFNQTLTYSGTSSEYQYSVNVIYGPNSYQEPFTIRVIKTG